MSKRVNNYRGKHRGWLQDKAPKPMVKKTGIPPIVMMWMNYAAKMGKFIEARTTLRLKLEVRGKKALTGVRRQKVLDRYFAVRYGD